MKNTFFIFCGLALILFSCGSSENPENKINEQLKNYSDATIELCQCAESGASDCSENLKKANEAYKKLEELLTVENEKKTDADKYSKILKSKTQITNDYTVCSRKLNE